MAKGNSKLSGGGAGGGSTTTGTRTREEFVEQLAQDMAQPYSDETPLTNSDMQAMVEAYAERNGLSFQEENAMMDDIRDRAEAIERVRDVNGYNVKTADGTNVDYYFVKNGDNTYYGTEINHIDEVTPNNWTEKQMINRIKSNGGTVSQYKEKEIVDKEVARIKDRRATDKFLNESYVQDKTMKKGSKANRIRGRVNKRK